MKKRAFLFNAVLLTASSLLLRAMNISYRSYLSSKIGPEGMGLYQLVLSVFVLAVTLSTSGVSLAVTRLVSEAVAANRPQTIRNAVCKCLCFSLAVSLAAMLAMFACASWIGSSLLDDPRIVIPLRLLAPGLPFMALCSCLKGYFLAVRGIVISACGEILEQILTIAVTATLFVLWVPSGIEAGCCAIMIGSTAGETASFTYLYIRYRFHVRKLRGKRPSEKSQGVFHKIRHIAMPITCSSTLRSGLSALENILIPIGFRKYGASARDSMSEYGMIQGMAMPVLFFPSSFLIAFSSLLIPEMSEANALGKERFIRHAASRSLQVTFLFSIFAAAVFFAFSGELGLLFYQNKQAGTFLRIFAPLVPVLYLDGVVDGMLKGLDQQLHSMKYNFSDSAIRVALIFFLIPLTGTRGYICVLFFSAIFNASLSIHRLIRTAQVDVRFLDWILKPALCGAIAVLLAMLPGKIPAIPHGPVFCALQILLAAILYYLLLRLSGSFRKEDQQWVRGIFLSSARR